MATNSSILAGKSHGQRSLVGCSPWCRKETDTTQCLNRQHHGRSNFPEQGERSLKAALILEGSRRFFPSCQMPFASFLKIILQCQFLCKGCSAVENHLPSCIPQAPYIFSLYLLFLPIEGEVFKRGNLNFIFCYHLQSHLAYDKLLTYICMEGHRLQMCRVECYL